MKCDSFIEVFVDFENDFFVLRAVIPDWNGNFRKKLCCNK